MMECYVLILLAVLGNSMGFTISQGTVNNDEANTYNRFTSHLDALHARQSDWSPPSSSVHLPENASRQLLHLFYLTQVLTAYRQPSVPPTKLDELVDELREQHFQQYLRFILQGIDGFDEISTLGDDQSGSASYLKRKAYFGNDQRQLIPVLKATLNAIHLDEQVNHEFRSKLARLRDAANNLTLAAVRERKDLIGQLMANAVTTEKSNVENASVSQREEPIEELFDIVSEENSGLFNSDEVDEYWFVLDDDDDENASQEEFVVYLEQPNTSSEEIGSEEFELESNSEVDNYDFSVEIGETPSLERPVLWEPFLPRPPLSSVSSISWENGSEENPEIDHLVHSGVLPERPLFRPPFVPRPPPPHFVLQHEYDVPVQNYYGHDFAAPEQHVEPPRFEVPVLQPRPPQIKYPTVSPSFHGLPVHYDSETTIAHSTVNPLEAEVESDFEIPNFLLPSYVYQRPTMWGQQLWTSTTEETAVVYPTESVESVAQDNTDIEEVPIDASVESNLLEPAAQVPVQNVTWSDISSHKPEENEDLLPVDSLDSNYTTNTHLEDQNQYSSNNVESPKIDKQNNTIATKQQTYWNQFIESLDPDQSVNHAGMQEVFKPSPTLSMHTDSENWTNPSELPPTLDVENTFIQSSYAEENVTAAPMATLSSPENDLSTSVENPTVLASTIVNMIKPVINESSVANAADTLSSTGDHVNTTGDGVTNFEPTVLVANDTVTDVNNPGESNPIVVFPAEISTNENRELLKPDKAFLPTEKDQDTPKLDVRVDSQLTPEKDNTDALFWSRPESEQYKNTDRLFENKDIIASLEKSTEENQDRSRMEPEAKSSNLTFIDNGKETANKNNFTDFGNVFDGNATDDFILDPTFLINQPETMFGLPAAPVDTVQLEEIGTVMEPVVPEQIDTIESKNDEESTTEPAIFELLDEYFAETEGIPEHYSKPDVVFESDKLPHPIDVSQPADLIEPTEVESTSAPTVVEMIPPVEMQPLNENGNESVQKGKIESDDNLDSVSQANQIDPVPIEESVTTANETNHDPPVSGSNDELAKPAELRRNALLHIKNDIRRVMKLLEEEQGYEISRLISENDVDESVNKLTDAEIQEMVQDNRVNRTATVHKLQHMLLLKHLSEIDIRIRLLELFKQPDGGYFDQHYGVESVVEDVGRELPFDTVEDLSNELKESSNNTHLSEGEPKVRNNKALEEELTDAEGVNDNSIDEIHENLESDITTETTNWQSNITATDKNWEDAIIDNDLEPESDKTRRSNLDTDQPDQTFHDESLFEAQSVELDRVGTEEDTLTNDHDINI